MAEHESLKPEDWPAVYAIFNGSFKNMAAKTIRENFPAADMVVVNETLETINKSITRQLAETDENLNLRLIETEFERYTTGLEDELNGDAALDTVSAVTAMQHAVRAAFRSVFDVAQQMKPGGHGAAL